jgi:hypothetical protein
VFIVTFSDACTNPRAMMIHFFYTYSADVAVAGSGRSVDIAGHTEFDAINFEGFGYYVGYLYMIFNLLIAWYLKEDAFHLILLILYSDGDYYFLNDARLSGGDPDEGVEVEELKGEK